MKAVLTAMITSVLISGASAFSSSAAAQDAAAGYPSRAVTFIVPSPPGATTDRDGRIWAQKLTQSLGKPYVLDFKAGAGTTIGTNFVARAAPDGHTLLLVTSSFPVIAATYKGLPFDPIKDFRAGVADAAPAHHAGGAPLAAGDQLLPAETGRST